MTPPRPLLLALALPMAAWSQDLSLVVVEGRLEPGGAVTVELRADWDGRPERHVIGVPELTVPEGAAVRPGTSSSSFDGDRSHWVTKMHVTLPSTAGPWTLGPASLSVLTPREGVQKREVPPVTAGGAESRPVLGHLLGSSGLVALVGVWFGLRWRGLPAQESSIDRRAAEALLTEQHDGWVQAYFSELKRLRQLSGRGPSAAELDEMHDALRFGGEQPDPAQLRELLQQIA